MLRLSTKVKWYILFSCFFLQNHLAAQCIEENNSPTNNANGSTGGVGQKFIACGNGTVNIIIFKKLKNP